MGLRSLVEKADVLGFSAVIAVCLFVALASVGLGIAVLNPDALPAWKEVFVVVMPTVSAILMAYGIIRGGADGDE